MRYTEQEGKKVIDFLERHGIHCELIGSLKKQGRSDHDIDVWVKEPDTEMNREKILKLLNTTSMVKTDWGGMYCKTENYGDVDIFFELPS